MTLSHSYWKYITRSFRSGNDIVWGAIFPTIESINGSTIRTVPLGGVLRLRWDRLIDSRTFFISLSYRRRSWDRRSRKRSSYPQTTWIKRHWYYYMAIGKPSRLLIRMGAFLTSLRDHFHRLDNGRRIFYKLLSELRSFGALSNWQRDRERNGTGASPF